MSKVIIPTIAAHKTTQDSGKLSNHLVSNRGAGVIITNNQKKWRNLIVNTPPPFRPADTNVVNDMIPE